MRFFNRSTKNKFEKAIANIPDSQEVCITMINGYAFSVYARDKTAVLVRFRNSSIGTTIVNGRTCVILDVTNETREAILSSNLASEGDAKIELLRTTSDIMVKNGWSIEDFLSNPLGAQELSRLIKLLIGYAVMAEYHPMRYKVFENGAAAFLGVQALTILLSALSIIHGAKILPSVSILPGYYFFLPVLSLVLLSVLYRAGEEATLWGSVKSFYQRSKAS